MKKHSWLIHLRKYNCITNTPIILEFEPINGPIPDRISCGDVNLDKNEHGTAITPKSSVFDNIIGVFFMLLNQGTICALDTAFFEMFQQAIRNNCIAIHTEFFEFFFRGCIVHKMDRLKT